MLLGIIISARGSEQIPHKISPKSSYVIFHCEFTVISITPNAPWPPIKAGFCGGQVRSPSLCPPHSGPVILEVYLVVLISVFQWDWNRQTWPLEESLYWTSDPRGEGLSGRKGKSLGLSSPLHKTVNQRKHFIPGGISVFSIHQSPERHRCGELCHCFQIGLFKCQMGLENVCGYHEVIHIGP